MRKAVIGILLSGLLTIPAAGTVRAGERAGNDLVMRLDGQGEGFFFVVTADMRYFAGPGQYDTSQYFRGAVEAVAALGGGVFMVTPGDDDPPDGVLWTIEHVLGADYTWYPVVGNHELPGQGVEAYYGANLDWLNSYDYGSVNPGPTGCPITTYSFDYGPAHFVMLDEYCDSAGQAATDGDVPDHLYNWLVNDLNSTAQEFIFVFGHEPAYPQPDADNGRLRHVGDSLDKYPENRDRFWDLLRDQGVAAYLCGHTHNYSAVEVDGVWQVDAGHARGLGDTGARSTFVVIRVADGRAAYETYRDDADGGPYVPVDRGRLWPRVSFVILHKDGAVYDSVDGWNTTTPPYYPASNYTRDIEITATGEDCILHQDGALWYSDTGWITTTPPYYAGSNYARDLELLEGGDYLILHQDGAIYDSVDGWNTATPPYYPGTGYAKDLEVR